MTGSPSRAPRGRGCPARDMTVAISVPGSFRRGQVEAAAADGSAGSGVAEVEAQLGRRSAVRYARAELTGLQPATEYDYRVLLDGVVASSGTFRTAPAGPVDFRFTAFGDQG